LSGNRKWCAKDIFAREGRHMLLGTRDLIQNLSFPTVFFISLLEVESFLTPSSPSLLYPLDDTKFNLLYPLPPSLFLCWSLTASLTTLLFWWLGHWQLPIKTYLDQEPVDWIERTKLFQKKKNMKRQFYPFNSTDRILSSSLELGFIFLNKWALSEEKGYPFSWIIRDSDPFP
jgi:hypothetical protein